MERRLFAVWLVLAGTLLGFLGNVLFFGRMIGLSLPLYVLVIVAVLLASSRLVHWTPDLRRLWPLIPMGFFAVMIAVRADHQILFLNLAAGMALAALTLHYLPLDMHIDTAPLMDYVSALTSAGFYLFPGPTGELVDSWKWLREKHLRDHQTFAAVGRGLLIMVPVLAVFAILLSSADLVFADYIKRLVGIFDFQGLDLLVLRGMITVGLGWGITGALAYGLARRDFGVAPAPADDTDEPAPAPIKRTIKPIQLGSIESTMILGSVDLLFGAFVLVQFAYFFGGRANISLAGLTYAQYARRGFFELVAVSMITLGLVLFLDWVTVRDGKRQNLLFRVLAVVIMALTTVMLISAAQRMWLYEQVYGFTHLRVYTHVFMVWLGILLGVFLLHLFRLRTNIFSLGVLLVAIGYLGTLNLMNVDGYIAERNIARYHEGEALDINFLRTLSVDAVPAMLNLYTQEKSNPIVYDGVGQWLAKQLNDLDHIRTSPDGTILSANLSREQAWAMLDAARADLPIYDPAVYWSRYINTIPARSGEADEAASTPSP